MLNHENNRRIAIVGITLRYRQETSKSVNQILSEYGNLILGRMGLPYGEREMSVIALIVDGTNDEIGALTGKIGNIRNVKVKVSFMI